SRDEMLRLQLALAGGSDADAAGQRLAKRAGGQLERRDRLPYVFRHLRGAGDRRLGQQHEELVAAVAASQVRPSKHGVDGARDGLQRRIALQVAERVVQRLEAVEIEHDDRWSLASPRGAAQVVAKHLDRVAAVEPSREAVADAVVL